MADITIDNKVCSGDDGLDIRAVLEEEKIILKPAARGLRMLGDLR